MELVLGSQDPWILLGLWGRERGKESKGHVKVRLQVVS